MSLNEEIIINDENNNYNNKSEEKKNNNKDSFDKVYNMQKLIHKQAGLKQLCKKKIIFIKYSYSRKRFNTF